jgi:hypothetical protein
VISDELTINVEICLQITERNIIHTNLISLHKNKKNLTSTYLHSNSLHQIHTQGMLELLSFTKQKWNLRLINEQL